MDASEYKRILAEHGRRVANRVAYAALGRGAGHDLNTFYAMYSPDSLPENERCRTGLIDRFDPCGLNGHYSNHPANGLSLLYRETGGASAYWFDQLVGARQSWGDWVIQFLDRAVREEESEALDRIAGDQDDQGEMVTVADDGRVCVWHAGWLGWTVWVRSLSDDDLTALRRVLRWLVDKTEDKFRHPEPGSEEAEAFLLKHKLVM